MNPDIEETLRRLHIDVLTAVNHGLNYLLTPRQKPSIDNLVYRYQNQLTITINLYPNPSLSVGLLQRGPIGPIVPLFSMPIPPPKAEEYPSPERKPVETQMIAPTEAAVTVRKVKPRTKPLKH